MKIRKEAGGLLPSKNKICEGCHEIITPDCFPHLERVWPGTHRQYWHTNCFVYANPPSTFDPPNGPSREFVEEGVTVAVAKIQWASDTRYVIK